MVDKSSSLLMHPVRRDIYRIIIESPGNYFLNIANTLDIPQGTVAWHLKKLQNAGLLETIKFGGKKIYFSPELRHPEIEKAFAVLKSKGAQQIFQFIINHRGTYQSEIARALNQHHDTVRHHITKLLEVNLIEFSKKKRSAHYFIGSIGKKILRGNIEVISRAYIGELFSKLRMECLIPTLLDYSDRHMTIKISCPESDDVIFSVKLKDWTFQQSDGELELQMPDLIDDDNEIQLAEMERPKVNNIDIERPKITNLE